MNKPNESKPLFAVGEVVILQSRSAPEMNGERTVLDVIPEGKLFQCPLSMLTGIAVGPGISYLLDGCEINPETGASHLWAESALRKRHQPGEYSFEDLKTILYLPQSRDEIARLDRGMQV